MNSTVVQVLLILVLILAGLALLQYLGVLHLG